MKTNHDGTITLNAYDTWTSCVACGKRVTGDSIHTCSPQLKEQDTECKYCKQGCFRCDARKLLTDEEMKDLIQEYWGDVHIVDPDGYLHEIAFIRAILRKANEKCTLLMLQCNNLIFLWGRKHQANLKPNDS